MMNRGLHLACLPVAAFLVGTPVSIQAADRPNIIFILADDLGYADLACTGAKDIRTPNIDSLARDGMIFNSFYVHQRCSPSRLAFMTGSYAHRAGTTKVIYARSRIGINSAEITTPELLKTAGYTCGMVCKWHLGEWEPFHPLNHGFDYYKGSWNVKAESDGPIDDEAGEDEKYGAFVENRRVIEPDYRKCGETEHEEVNGALAFIQASKDRPFFLYYASRGTHSKWTPGEKFRGTSPCPNNYGDAVQEMDFEIGRILGMLDELGIAKNTLVVFGSDNGAPLNSPGPSNAPLRDGKWTNFEGGIRTHFLMRWPGKIPPGTATDTIAGIWDLLPTFCAISGVPPPTDRVLDGVDLLPVMLGRESDPPLPRQVVMDGSIIRLGDWKLYLSDMKPGGGKAKKDPSRLPAAAGELFNVVTDPGETRNVATEHPDLVTQLRAAADAFGDELVAHSRRIGRLDENPSESSRSTGQKRKREEKQTTNQ